jgi:hypothetical protein
LAHGYSRWHLFLSANQVSAHVCLDAIGDLSSEINPSTSPARGIPRPADDY